MVWADAVSGTLIKVAELFTITLADGTILRYTSFESDILYSGDTYTAIPLNRDPTVKTTDLDVAETIIRIPHHDDYIDTAKLFKRYLDNAEIQIRWIQRTNHANTRLTFAGDSAEVGYNNTAVEIAFKNELNFFRKRIPIRVYSQECSHQMYDDLCKLIKNTLKVTGTAGAGSNLTTIVDAGRTESDGYFSLGYIEMTSGSNNGEKRMVKLYVTGNISVLIPFQNSTLGQTYNLFPFCKKNFTSCDVDFSNAINYGGFQDIPRPQQAM